MKLKVISGGQTGADQAGLDAAKGLGITTGGYMPRGFYTEAGCKPEFESKYGMIAVKGDDGIGGYRIRTLHNVENSDVTLWFGDAKSPGGRLTLRYCDQLKKPFMVISSGTMIAEVLVHLKKVLLDMPTGCREYFTINIAGNRESKNPGIYDNTKSFVSSVLSLFRDINPIFKEMK
jgi:hypothetical protein